MIVLDGSSGGLTSTPRWSLDGDQYLGDFGASVATADPDADGFDDLLVGDPQFSVSPMLTGEGRVQAFLGGPAGASEAPILERVGRAPRSSSARPSRRAT